MQETKIDNTFLEKLFSEITSIKKQLVDKPAPAIVTDKWISRQEVMNFLNYGPTQMAEFEKTGDIVVTKIGKRKFILKESLETLLNKNIIN